MSQSTQASSPKLKKQKALRILLIITGTISLGLGAVGIFFPLLPTTPFLLISAACYLRGSERMYNWLLKNRWFGEYIKNYQEGRGIPLKTKILAISVLWITYSLLDIFHCKRNFDYADCTFDDCHCRKRALLRLPTLKKVEHQSVRVMRILLKRLTCAYLLITSYW